MGQDTQIKTLLAILKKDPDTYNKEDKKNIIKFHISEKDIKESHRLYSITYTTRAEAERNRPDLSKYPSIESDASNLTKWVMDGPEGPRVESTRIL